MNKNPMNKSSQVFVVYRQLLAGKNSNKWDIVSIIKIPSGYSTKFDLYILEIKRRLELFSSKSRRYTTIITFISGSAVYKEITSVSSKFERENSLLDFLRFYVKYFRVMGYKTIGQWPLKKIFKEVGIASYTIDFTERLFSDISTDVEFSVIRTNFTFSELSYNYYFDENEIYSLFDGLLFEIELQDTELERVFNTTIQRFGNIDENSNDFKLFEEFCNPILFPKK